MRRHDGPVDVCIVGAGAAGCTLAKTLAEGGMSVVVLEAGDWLDTVEDFVNDELESLGKLDWDDLRITAGSNPLNMGRSNTGRAVGGSTVHFTAMKLRLHPDDFELRTRQGLAVDWPFGYNDLEPFYSEAERFVGVSGPREVPWEGFGAPYPQGELPLSASDETLAAGFEKLGYRWAMTPHAILTGAMDGRSPCMNYGFCVQGCKSDAKGSALVTWVPAAVRAGAEFRERAFATRIELSPDGRASSVEYVQNGAIHRQEARIIIVSCYSVETPRLLLNSACPQFPQGLANTSGMVGKNLMVHPGSEVFGRFEQPLDNFVTPPVGIISQDFYGTARVSAGLPRGFTVNRYSYFPIEFATTLISDNADLWGERLHEVMDTYPCWTILSSMNEMLPSEDNRVELAEETDQNGVRVAKITMSYSELDNRLLADSAAISKQVMEAAGAKDMLTSSAAYHVLGTCRMGRDPKTSVVDEFCRSHDIPNLLVCDGSVFPTCGAVNPSLTIEAIALRTAKRLLEAGPS